MGSDADWLGIKTPQGILKKQKNSDQKIDLSSIVSSFQCHHVRQNKRLDNRERMKTKIEIWFSPINQSEFWEDKVVRQLSKMIETYYDEVFEFWVPGVCLTGSSSMCKNRLEPIKNFEIYIFQASLSSVLSGIYYQPWFSQGKKKCLCIIIQPPLMFSPCLPLLCEAPCFIHLHRYRIWSHQGVEV